jgi:hypothetical protein
VVKAEPPTRAEFEKSKRLMLTLARVELQHVDPRAILYSLPTINDRLPEEDVVADGSEMVLTEDDWRQFEFVSLALRYVVEDEIGAIDQIHHDHRRGMGFEEIHARRIDRPVDDLPVDAVAQLELEAAGPLRLDRHGHRVRGGFAHTLPGGWLLYGTADGGEITTLALHPTEDAPPPDVVNALDELAAEHGLLLVDWCRCAVGEPGTESFAAAFA